MIEGTSDWFTPITTHKQEFMRCNWQPSLSYPPAHLHALTTFPKGSVTSQSSIPPSTDVLRKKWMWHLRYDLKCNNNLQATNYNITCIYVPDVTNVIIATLNDTEFIFYFCAILIELNFIQITQMNPSMDNVARRTEPSCERFLITLICL